MNFITKHHYITENVQNFFPSPQCTFLSNGAWIHEPVQIGQECHGHDPQLQTPAWECNALRIIVSAHCLYISEVVNVFHILVQYAHYGGSTYTKVTFACSETYLLVDGKLLQHGSTFWLCTSKAPDSRNLRCNCQKKQDLADACLESAQGKSVSRLVHFHHRRHMRNACRPFLRY